MTLNGRQRQTRTPALAAIVPSRVGRGRPNDGLLSAEAQRGFLLSRERCDGRVHGPQRVLGALLANQHLCDVARSTADDVELALDAAHAAAPAWGRTSPAERANILNKIADQNARDCDLLAWVFDASSREYQVIRDWI